MGIRSWWDRFSGAADQGAAEETARKVDDQLTALLSGGGRKIYESNFEYTMPSIPLMVCEAVGHTLPTITVPSASGFVHWELECEYCHHPIAFEVYNPTR